MALSYPIDFADFVDMAECQVNGGSFYLPDGRGYRTTRGGVILDYRRAERLWKGSLSVVPLTHAAAAALEAKISLLQEVGAFFNVYDKRKLYPENGAIASNTVSLASVTSSGRDVTFTGLPHALVPGDAFCFSYGSSPTRRAYHRIAHVDGSIYQVTPALRSGYTLGSANLIFNKAFMRAKVDIEGVEVARGQAGRHSQGLTFAFTQTLRG